MTKQTITIRPYALGDELSIENICYRTGYFGKPASPVFGDKHLFALIYALPYLNHDANGCFVAVLGDKVVGYCMGTSDTDQQKLDFARLQVPLIKKRIIRHTMWRFPRDVFKVWQWSRAPNLKSDLSGFPSHFHMNIDPAFHRRGIGTRLLQAFEAEMSKRNVAGIHLFTSSANMAAIGLYKTFGYEPEICSDTNIWRQPGVCGVLFRKGLVP